MPSGSLPTFNLSSDSSSDSDDSDSDSDLLLLLSLLPLTLPLLIVALTLWLLILMSPALLHHLVLIRLLLVSRTAPNAGPSRPASSWIPSPSASPAPDDDAASTPRSSPDAPSNLRRSTRARKPPVEFWKLPKDRQPAPAPVPDASDEGPSGSDADTAVHLANCAASRALSEQELVEYAFLTSGHEPRTLHDALCRDDAPLWQEAAQAEYNALLEHGVWDLAECPADRKPIGCGWVFRIKYKADGTVEHYKAHLVAKGFAQKPHLDYTETFAPVVKFASLRTIIAVAAMEDLELDSMDISSAFLNGDLDEEIYMSQPEGFAVPGKEHLVCRLKKSLYGLKQSPRQWYQKLNETFMQLGFRRIQSDNCIYVWAKDGLRIMIPVFVDDLTLAATGRPLMDSIKAELQRKFKMRDLGPLHYILGIQVIRDRSKRLIYLSQAKHIEDVLSKHNMSNCRPVSTPLDKSVTLSKDDCPDSPDEVAYMSSVPYLSAVGSLMYLAVGTRPDIAYAVGALSRFNSNPGRVHWQQCQRVFRYLQGTRDLMLQYGGKSDIKLDVYSDADYAGDLDSARSTSGYAAFIGTSLVSWASRRQPVVAKSTTEAEYIAANTVWR